MVLRELHRRGVKMEGVASRMSGPTGPAVARDLIVEVRVWQPDEEAVPCHQDRGYHHPGPDPLLLHPLNDAGSETRCQLRL